MKYTAEQIHEMLPDDEIKLAFISRDDIKELTPDQQENRWTEHKIAVDKFIERLSNLDCFVIPVSGCGK